MNSVFVDDCRYAERPWVGGYVLRFPDVALSAYWSPETTPAARTDNVPPRTPPSHDDDGPRRALRGPRGARPRPESAAPSGYGQPRTHTEHPRRVGPTEARTGMVEPVLIASGRRSWNCRGGSTWSRPPKPISVSESPSRSMG